MFDFKNFTENDFQILPKVIEGESKEIRYFQDDLVVIKFKPSIYSFTHNRCGIVPGSDFLRLQASKKFLNILKQNNIKHAYQEINDRFVLSKLVVPHPVEYQKYQSLTSNFLNYDFISHCSKLRGTPLEIIIKTFHGGTSKHRYQYMHQQKVRNSHPLFAGMKIVNEEPYPQPLIRFDWRNPLQFNEKRIQDEILPDSLADFFIDVNKAKSTALKVHEVLEEFLGERNIICNDLCLFIAEDGETLYGEISQDCGRFRHFDLGSLDKDVWRGGGSDSLVLEKWQKLLNCLEE